MKHLDFNGIVQRLNRPGRVSRGTLTPANLAIVAKQVAANKALLEELVAVPAIEEAILAHRAKLAEAERKAKESAKRAAEKEAAARKAKLAEAAKAQAEAAVAEAEALEAEAQEAEAAVADEAPPAKPKPKRRSKK